jgi:hypothetical protein
LVWIVDVFVLVALTQNVQATSTKVDEWELHQNKKLLHTRGKIESGYNLQIGRKYLHAVI